MTTAIFIITANNKAPQSLNQRHLVFPCTGVDTMADSSQLTQGGSKVRRSSQSTLVGGACTELRHSDGNLRTAWFEKGDLKKKKKHWVDFYNYRMDVYTHFQHTFMFKQHVKWILHLMTPLTLYIILKRHLFNLTEKCTFHMSHVKHFRSVSSEDAFVFRRMLSM